MLTIEENIFDLLGKGSTMYHSAIMTTFSFDPYYFSNYYMPQMRSRGIKNIIVLVDSTQYDAMMEDEEVFNDFRNDFTLLRVKNATNGVFHSKVSLFMGNKQALALVGSGNLTYSGMSHNRELWGAFCADSIDAEEALVVREIWDYLYEIIMSSGSRMAKQQLDWCMTYSTPVRDFQEIDIDRASHIRFLHSEPDKSMFNQIKAIVKEEVREIKIIAPFYDSHGDLICQLKNTYNPRIIKCAIDDSYGYIPYEMKKIGGIQFFHWHEIFGSDDQFEMAKRLHAKSIQFETSGGNYLVLGSANATSSAFGLNLKSFNDEANLIIHSQDVDFFQTLGIDFNDSHVNAIDDFNREKKCRTRESKQSSLIHIILCERELNGKLNISFDKIIPDIKVRLYFDKEYKDFDFNEDGIDVAGLGETKYVVAVLDNTEVSNKHLVFNLADLEKRNPDSKFSKIESLFYSNNGDWDDNISKVLSYVNFDIKDNGRSGHISKSKSESSEKNETVISKEQFGNTRFSKSIDADIYSVNMRILDQIQFSHSHQQENSEEIDEQSSLDDIVQGNAEDESQARKILKTYSAKNEILSYLKRLKRHYDNLAEDFDNQNFYMLQSQGRNFDDVQVSCNDYSYVLIALMLIFQRIVYPIKGDNNIALYKRYFAELSGRFMMIYRNGYPDTNDYTYIKLEEMHRNFFVYSLLMLSMSNFDRASIEVWTLNLLDTFKDDSQKIMKYYHDYSSLADEYNGLMKSFAIEAVQRALEKYVNFIKTGGTIDTISQYSENFYFYRAKFGFMFCKKVSRLENESELYYHLEVIYPGIKNLETAYTINKTKVRIL